MVSEKRTEGYTIGVLRKRILRVSSFKMLPKAMLNIVQPELNLLNHTLLSCTTCIGEWEVVEFEF